MGKFTISMVIFHSYVELPEGMLGQMHPIPGFRPNPMGFRIFRTLRSKRSATCNSCRKPLPVQAPGERDFYLAILDGEHHPTFGIGKTSSMNWKIISDNCI